jgi:hypothetical protein
MTRRPTRRAATGRVWLVLLAVGLAGCVSHPVGPARTYGKYEGKAVTTAESALSATETVRLAAVTGGNGDAFGPYLSVAVSDQEEALSGVQGTFGSIQPPNAAADELRTELDGLLSTALDRVTDVRVAIRRGELDRLDEEARPLARSARDLERFIEAHR